MSGLIGIRVGVAGSLLVDHDGSLDVTIIVTICEYIMTVLVLEKGLLEPWYIFEKCGHITCTLHWLVAF